MKIVLQHSSPKTQIEHFWSQVFLFSFFHFRWNLQLHNSRVLTKHLLIVFIKLQPKNTLVFLAQNLIFFYFWMKLCVLTILMLISNTTLAFWNSSQKYSIKAILVPNLSGFIFDLNFVFAKIWGCWFKMPQYSSFFDFQTKDTQIKQFLVLYLIFFSVFFFFFFC